MFVVFALPGLFLLSLLQPLRIYLRPRSITLPVTYCSFASVVLHVPLNYLLAVQWKMGIAGVAPAMVWTNFNLLLCLILFILISGVYRESWVSQRGWSELLKQAVSTSPSALSGGGTS